MGALLLVAGIVLVALWLVVVRVFFKLDADWETYIRNRFAGRTTFYQDKVSIY